MLLEKVLFYIFAGIAIFSALMVITSKKPVRAVLFLVLAFVASSGMWILLQAEFLAIILILVYVGAVMVLFLFVVMMLDLNFAPTQEKFIRYLPIGVILGVALLVELFYVLGPERFGLQNYKTPAALPETYSNIKALGDVLYTHYVLGFELAALVLLVAMIAAVALTFRGPKDRKTQVPGKQVQVKKSDRLKIVSMEAETNKPAPEEG